MSLIGVRCRCLEFMMVSIFVNSEVREIREKSTISDLLAELRINNRYCAVEQNREVVPREQHSLTVLSEGDKLEIVTLVGGG